MCQLVVKGGTGLRGEVRAHGAKNAILPILAGSLLNKNESIIHNCPRISDVYNTIDILSYLGCNVKWEDDTLIVDSAGMNNYIVPEELMKEMRSSVIFMGAIISRCGRADITYPGGCEIGARPIDLHIKAFKNLGISIREAHGRIICRGRASDGRGIMLDFPSVGATENIMLLTALSDGTTVISNAAKEPEIVDLQDFLNAMGARISGAGTGVITIEGVRELNSVEYTVMPDRIETVSYLAAAAVTGGDIIVRNARCGDLQAVLTVLQEAGCRLSSDESSIALSAPPRLTNVEYIRTMPYPGFPTDAQAVIMAMLSVADGVSVFAENIFENRYKHVGELNRMGSNILVDGKLAVIRGVPRLSGADVTAADLRGAAALVVAALAAEGTTHISGIELLDRGYVHFEDGLNELGAEIKRIE